jgi:hypothetical protein
VLGKPESGDDFLVRGLLDVLDHHKGIYRSETGRSGGNGHQGIRRDFQILLAVVTYVHFGGGLKESGRSALLKSEKN